MIAMIAHAAYDNDDARCSVSMLDGRVELELRFLLQIFAHESPNTPP